MRKIFLFIIAIVCLTSCEELNKVDFLNLKRDNPLDGKSNENMQNGVAIKYDSYYVYSDNNNDDIINKGETVKLNISLKNTGKSDASSVKATFSTTSQYLSGFTPTSQISYGNISAGSTVWKGDSQYYDYAIQFTVSNTTPANTNIPITINIIDGNGNSWTESFNIVVGSIGANIIYNSQYVYSDNNNDDLVNKGETVKLNIGLQNTGSSTANGVKATFSTTSQYVSGFTPTSQISYGNISAGSTVWKGNSQYYDYAIQFTVSNTTPANTNIPISISIVDESGNTWTANFNVTVSATNANISYSSYYVYSDNNNDDLVNKGETVKLNIGLQNTGSSTVNGVKATFSTTSQYVSGFTPTSQISYGNISAGSTVWKGNSQYYDYAIQFTVSNTTPANTNIPISISIVDESGNTWISSFNVTVQ
ncbi:MAG: hypothetical protein GZ091_14485 [Paludibacter sp.]|nr:hypothetical protein [Paludibacter sp.]